MNLAASSLSEKPSAAPSLPISPARAALARAIEALDAARERLDQAQRPVTRLDQVLAAARCRDADELRAEVARLRSAEEAEIRRWVEAGADGARPEPSAELLAAERRLGEIAGAACAAETEISIAQEGYAGAAERTRHATAERDRALWPATIEAADPVIAELEQAVAAVRLQEVRLRGLAAALREAGNRDAQNGNGAFAAASAIEARILATRRIPAPAQDGAPGRSLLDRLRSDPRAEL